QRQRPLKLMCATFNRSLLLAIAITTRTLVAADIWTGEYSFDETYIGEANVVRGKRRVSDFDESDTFIRFVLTPRIKAGVLRLGVEYEQFLFGLSQGAPIPYTLQSVDVVVCIYNQISDYILMCFVTILGVYCTV